MFMQNGGYFLRPDGSIIDIGAGKHRAYATANLRGPPGDEVVKQFCLETGYYAITVYMGIIRILAYTRPTQIQTDVIDDMKEGTRSMTFPRNIDVDVDEKWEYSGNDLPPVNAEFVFEKPGFSENLTGIMPQVEGALHRDGDVLIFTANDVMFPSHFVNLRRGGGTLMCFLTRTYTLCPIIGHPFNRQQPAGYCKKVSATLWQLGQLAEYLQQDKRVDLHMPANLVQFHATGTIPWSDAPYNCEPSEAESVKVACRRHYIEQFIHRLMGIVDDQDTAVMQGAKEYLATQVPPIPPELQGPDVMDWLPERSEYTLGEMKVMNYYRALGVARGASVEEIHQAYRAAARKYHPDVSKEPDAGEKMKVINEAWAVLGNPEGRVAYDASLPAGGGAPTPRQDTYYGWPEPPWEWAEMPRDEWEALQARVREGRRQHEITRTQAEFERLWRSAGRGRGPQFCMTSDAEVWECIERIKQYGKCWAPAHLTHMSRGVYQRIYGVDAVKGYIYVDGVPSYTAVVVDIINEVPADEFYLLPWPHSDKKVTTWHLVTEIRMLPVPVLKVSN